MNKAIREWFDWRGWVVVLAAAVVLLALLAILSPDVRSFIAHPATAGWAAAIATASATFAALWISGQKLRRQSAHDALSRASLTCIIETELLTARTAISALPKTIQDLRPGNLSQEEIDAVLMFFKFVEPRLEMPTVSKFFPHLPLLGEEACIRVSLAFGGIIRLRQGLNDVIEHPYILHKALPEAIDSIIQRAQETLSDINKIKWLDAEGTLGES